MYVQCELTPLENVLTPESLEPQLIDTYESLFMIGGIVTGSLGFLILVQRIWPIEQRRAHNDLIGWHLTVLGTTYAVIIGFMLYAVWNNFELATANAEAEADCLVNIVRLAQRLPDTQREPIQVLASEYVDIMLNQEWPAMAQVKLSPASSDTFHKLWAVVTTGDIRSPMEQLSRDHVLTEISQMTEHRRLRQLQVYADLPRILWDVLIFGAVVTLVSACLFGSVDFKLHFVQVAALSLLVSLVLVAIADINGPFQGAVHVAPSAFERARGTLNEFNRGSTPLFAH